MRTIAVMNQKGGVGKTTTSTNLACGLARKRYRVLVLDLDAQANATTALAHHVEGNSGPPRTIVRVFEERGLPLSDVIVETQWERVWLAPSDIGLAYAVEQLYSQPFAELILAKQLERIADRFDYCIVDCPPSLTVITTNGLVAASAALIPTELTQLSLYGIAHILQRFRILEDSVGHRLSFRILPCRLTGRGAERQEMNLGELSSLDDQITTTRIRETDPIKESQDPNRGPVMPIVLREKGTAGRADYRRLVDEVERTWPAH